VGVVLLALPAFLPSAILEKIKGGPPLDPPLKLTWVYMIYATVT